MSVILHFFAVTFVSVLVLRGDPPPTETRRIVDVALSFDSSHPSTRIPRAPEARSRPPFTLRAESTGSQVPPQSSPNTPPTSNATEGDDESPSPSSPSSSSLSYISFLRSQIELHKQYPREALLRREEGLVEVSVTLEKSGQLTELSISKGATPALDRAALGALRSLSGLPPPPPELRAPLKLRIPLRFELRSSTRK